MPSPSPLPQVRRRVLAGWTAVGVAGLVVCWALYHRDVRQVEQTALDREVTRSNFFGNLFDADYRATAADLRVLAESDDLQDALQQGTPRAYQRFARDMASRLQQQPEYGEMSLIDEAGDIRLHAGPPQDGPAPMRRIPATERPYFAAALGLPRGEILLSPMRLERIDGKVAQPQRSFVRMLTPVFDSQGRRRGALGVDYLGAALFSHFDTLSPAAQRHVRVLNAEGYWIKAGNPAEEWGFEYPDGRNRTLARTDPALWAQIQAKPEGQAPYNGGWFTWRRIDPAEALHQPPEPASALIAGSELPRDEWAALSEQRGTPYLVVGAALLAMAAAGAAIHDARVRERKRTEDALRLAHDHAQASSKLKAQFLANMSHEIRTPLNGVVGMTGLLLDTSLSAEQRSYANTVRTSADALLALINDILDFSKIEAGQLEFERVPFDLRDPVENCLSLAAEKAHAKNLELAYLIEDNVPTALIGDPHRLHQVLLNLVGNAVKFTPRGEVVLRVSREGEEEGQAILRFAVRDTGPGVPPEVAARLFQPFVQADSSTSRQFGGTGLGLAICRQLVTLMGGKIAVEPAPGGGALFWFTARFSLGTLTPRVVPRKADLAGLRALVIDDSGTNREILSRQLSHWRLEVATATDGIEALTVLRAAAAAGAPFQFAIFDMDMPNLSGLDAAEAAHGDAALEGLRTLILTSVGHPLSRTALDRAGVSSCLIKPVRQSQLHDAMVEAFVGAPNPVSESRSPVPGAEGDGHPPLRILVVEDNPVNQHVARLQLEKFGYRPDIVGGGGEALEMLRQRPYDVVLMDCQMPGIDGFETTRRIRIWEAERRVSGELFEPLPVVAMTANAMSGDRDLCLAAGMQDYITKPVRANELAAALARSQVARSESAP